MERKKTTFRPLFTSPGMKPAPPPFIPAKQKKDEDDDLFARVPTLPEAYAAGGPRIPKYRDMALIVAGFAVLLLAPMIEFSISSPREDHEVLKSGLNVHTGDFGDARVFEDGVTIITPGGPTEGDGHITPLQARDPAGLIIPYFDGEREVRPRPKPRPVRPPEPDNWKGALNAAAKRGVAKAAVATRRWAPAAGKLASKLNSFSSGSGSGSRAATTPMLSAPSHDGLLASNPSQRSSMSPVRASTDYRGAWRSGTAGTGGGAGAGLSGGFLQNAKSLQGPGSGISSDGTQVPGVDGSALSQRGASAGGGPGRGGDIEHVSLTSAKDNSNITINQKEDLAWQRRKLEMQKSIELKWAKKTYDQVERKKMLEQIAAQTASQAFLKVLDKLLQLGGGKKDDKGGGGG